MTRLACLAGLALALLPAPLAAQGRPAPAAPPAADLEARRAVAGADVTRLLSDPAYATEMLGHLDRLDGLAGNPGDNLRIDNARLIALAGLRRREEVGVVIDRVLAQQPVEPAFYFGPWLAARVVGDDDRALATIETASRNVPGVAWAGLRQFLGRENVGALLANLRRADRAKQVRLAAALFRIGWPGGGEVVSADMLRSILLEDRLRAGDTQAAAGFAAGIATPYQIVPMIVQTRYDAVLAPGRERLEVLRESLDANDRETATALAAAPGDLRVLHERVQHLRAVGRNAEALALVEPLTADIAATVARAEEGMWLINHGAYALMALGRADEALALMERLTAPIAGNGRLISAAINRAEMLGGAGRPAEALAYARGLLAEHGEFASDYGKSWLDTEIVCALAALGRGGEGAAELGRLRAQRELNPGAATRAFLCLGDEAAAAALMIERLRGDNAAGAVLALQDFSESRGGAQTGPAYDRLVALRDRPDVRAALARVGRVLTLPLARAGWGNF